jgi:hypothetical protein
MIYCKNFGKTSQCTLTIHNNNNFKNKLKNTEKIKIGYLKAPFSSTPSSSVHAGSWRPAAQQ